MTAAYMRRYRRPRAGAPRPRAAGERDDRADHRVDRAADRGRAMPTRSTGTCTFRRRLVSRSTGRYPTSASTQMDQGEEVEGAERKRDPVDFALWKAQKPDEDTAWDSPWGRGGPGGTSSARRWPRRCWGPTSRSTAAAATSSSPTTRTRPPRPGPRTATPLARLWVHNGMVRLDKEKMAKSVGNIFLLHEALASYGRDALVMYFCGGHYRQPIEFDAERLEEARARVDRIREAAQAAPRRALAGLVAGRCASASSRRWQTTSTRPAALAAVFDWVREANRSAAAVGDATCARCSACWRSRTCSSAPSAEAPPEVRELLRQRASAPARRATTPRPTACGIEIARSAGRSATARRGRSCCRERDRLRPQPRARGAARRRAVARVWATKNAAREPWLAGAAVALETELRGGHRAPLRSPAHQGVCAEAEPVPLRERRSLLQTSRR